MSESPYRRLARRLDAIPNGFPATKSGVELRLLAKIFAPEEAALAAVMRLAREPAADIANRADMNPDTALACLKQMASRGLISAKLSADEALFGLMPFIVGIYENQLPRMDQEMATLFEQYYQESRAGILQDAPSVHRVIPVGKSIPFDVEIFSHEQASALLEGARSWGVRDCICRVQQHLVGRGCDHPVETCLVFAPVEGAFDHSEVDRPLTKEEALDILDEAAEAGLVHSTGNYRDGRSYICNCCTCCCGVMRGVAEFGIPTAIAHSDFHSVVDADLCAGCGDCAARCQFGAISVPDYVAVVDYVRCVGCGQCITVCPTDALLLERRPAGETPVPPGDIREWMVQRAQARRISMADVL